MGDTMSDNQKAILQEAADARRLYRVKHPDHERVVTCDHRQIKELSELGYEVVEEIGGDDEPETKPPGEGGEGAGEGLDALDLGPKSSRIIGDMVKKGYDTLAKIAEADAKKLADEVWGIKEDNVDLIIAQAKALTEA